jgi:5-methylcytosine-specific restriction endonuclease McrA
MTQPWYRWPTGLRARILQRDSHLCRIQGEGCTVVAAEVDHIVSPRDGGAWFDPSNLRAACAHCNHARGAVQAVPPGQYYVQPSRSW